MASPSSIMDYEESATEDCLYVNEPTIELPNRIWKPMVDLHTRILSVIPKTCRSFWCEKVDKFYLKHFKNLKPKKDSISEIADEVIDEIYASDEETYLPLKRKTNSKQKNKDDIMKLIRNSISIGNE